jgi:hypothetical protein
MALISHLIGHEAAAALPDAELDRLSAVIDQHLLTTPEITASLQPKVNEALAAIRTRTNSPAK